MESNRYPLTNNHIALDVCTCIAIVLAAASVCCGTERVEFINDEGSRSSLLINGPSFKVALAAEELPSGTTSESDGCKMIVDAPLCALSVDTQPVERAGQVDLSAARPADCGSYAIGAAPTLFVGSDAASPPDSSCGHACQGWQFCHRPLYFEERCLEIERSRSSF
jgi:hypothetical protein